MKLYQSKFVEMQRDRITLAKNRIASRRRETPKPMSDDYEINKRWIKRELIHLEHYDSYAEIERNISCYKCGFVSSTSFQ